MPNFFGKLLGNKVVDLVENMMNPEIGHHFPKFETPQFLYRYDGRAPKDLYNAGGFKARVDAEALKKLRREALEHYQSYNTKPFGIGACISYSDLEKGYGAENSAQARESTLYGFYASAISINHLRSELIGEGNKYDNEKEHLVLETVNWESIVFATGPKFRNKYTAGLQVPNECFEFNKDVPSSFKITNVVKSC